jgi:hypothetical protein
MLEPPPPCPVGTDPAVWQFYISNLMLLQDIQERLWNEELHRFRKNQQANQARLVEAFQQHGIDFRTEIAPLFSQTYHTFVAIWTTRKALQEVRQEIGKQQKRYRPAVHMLGEKGSPFSPALTHQLSAAWTAMTRIDLKALAEKCMRQAWPEAFDGVSASLTKEFHKHPAWRRFEHATFQVLREKGLSQTQAIRLIALIWETYLPHQFSATFKDDVIRHRLKA